MGSIGLKRGTVTVVPHNTRWAAEFEKEKKRIVDACGDQIIAIEHIGSTSVQGMAAKPIIDMSAGIARLYDARSLIEPLSKIGYGFYKQFQHQMLFCKGPDTRRTHYLHVMRYRGSKWQNDLLFRDYLRTHPEEVWRYTNLKETLAARYANDRQSYSDGKDRYIKSVIEKAREDSRTQH